MRLAISLGAIVLVVLVLFTLVVVGRPAAAPAAQSQYGILRSDPSFPDSAAYRATGVSQVATIAAEIRPTEQAAGR